jgi:hypothetical protein
VESGHCPEVMSAMAVNNSELSDCAALRERVGPVSDDGVRI